MIKTITKTGMFLVDLSFIIVIQFTYNSIETCRGIQRTCYNRRPADNNVQGSFPEHSPTFAQIKKRFK